MKKITVFIFCLMALYTQAQNTFPATGNVGIGTLTPNSSLEIYTSKDYDGIRIEHTINNFWTRYLAGSLLDNSWNYISRANDAGIIFGGKSIGNSQGFVIAPWAAATSGIRIDNKGNVGIGTASPGVTLDVNGAIRVGANQPIYFLGGPDGKGFDDRGYLIQSVGWSIGMQYKHFTSHQFFTEGDKERLRITQNGNVGIGTASPGVTLDVNGAIRVGANQPIYFLGGPDDKGYLIQSGGWSNGMQYKHFTSHQFFTNGDNERLRITQNGNVGIGTTNPTQKLSVNGTIQAKEIVVNTGWSDFVFDNNYKLRPLNEVEQFVKTNKHLPEIPSQKEVEKNGVQLGDISSKLLMKIEELTLYMIEMSKKMKLEEDKNKYQTERIKALEQENRLLNNTISNIHKQ